MTAPSNDPGAGSPPQPAPEEDWDVLEGVEASARAWEKADHDSDPYSAAPAPPPAPYLRRVWAQSEVETIEEALDLHDALAATGPAAFSTTATDTAAAEVQDPNQDGDVAQIVGAAGGGDSGPDDDDDDVIQVKYATKYADVYEWYEKWFRHAYTRRIDGRRRYWSATWYTHTEVLERMDALWRTWEKKRRDPEVGASEWYLHHADPHMSFLMSPEGPFADLDHRVHGESSSMEPLPWTPPGTPPEASSTTDPETDPDVAAPRASMSMRARYRARRVRRPTRD